MAQQSTTPGLGPSCHLPVSGGPCPWGPEILADVSFLSQSWAQGRNFLRWMLVGAGGGRREAGSLRDLGSVCPPISHAVNPSLTSQSSAKVQEVWGEHHNFCPNSPFGFLFLPSL